MQLKIPKFKNEDAERDFWSRVKLNDYFEPSDFAPVSFPNLKPSSHPTKEKMALWERISVEADKGRGVKEFSDIEDLLTDTDTHSNLYGR